MKRAHATTKILTHIVMTEDSSGSEVTHIPESDPWKHLTKLKLLTQLIMISDHEH